MKPAERARRARNVAAGLCQCGRARENPRWRKCSTCRQQAKDCERRRAAARAEKGVCRECGRRPPDTGVVMCRRCRRRGARASAAVRRVYVDSGLCQDCGREGLKDGGIFGPRCAEARAKRKRDAYVPTGRPPGRPRKVTSAPLPDLPAVDPRQVALPGVGLDS